MEPLKVALLGLRGEGSAYFSAIRSSELYELVAVGDRDAERLRRCCEATPIATYQDFRSLVVENAPRGLDAIFVALEPFESQDFLKAAAERGVPVFHKAPLARTAADARSVAGWFEKAGAPLVVARPWAFEPAYRDLAGIEELIGRVYTATVSIRTTAGADGWRGDSVRAGGGVLLNGAYEPLDLIVHLMGRPECVGAYCNRAVPPGRACSYDTEDAAQASLWFSETRTATVSAFRHAARVTQVITLAGDRGTLDLTEKKSVFEPRGRRQVQDAPRPDGLPGRAGRRRLRLTASRPQGRAHSVPRKGALRHHGRHRCGLPFRQDRHGGIARAVLTPKARYPSGPPP